MKHEESVLQCEIVDALSLLGVYLFSVPNERKASAAQMSRMIHMGLRAGIADLILMGDDGRAYFLEIKTPTGRLSEAQERFRRLCLERGWPYAIARSVAEATHQATVWGLIK